MICKNCGKDLVKSGFNVGIWIHSDTSPRMQWGTYYCYDRDKSSRADPVDDLVFLVWKERTR